MGVIKRQAIEGTIITYFAVIVGFINTAILMPKVDTEVIGLVNILVAYTLIIRLVGGLGFGAITTRFFAYFRNERNNHNGFMFIAVSVLLIGSLLSIIVIFIAKYFISKNRPSDDLFMHYFYYLIPLVLFTLILTTFDDYYKVIYKSVRGTILKEFVQKVCALIAVFVLVKGYVEANGFVLVYTIGYCVPGLIILLMIIYEKQLTLKPQLYFIDTNLRNNMLSVGLFGIMSSAVGVLAITIDKIMLESYLGLSYTGVYSIAFYFGGLIAIPSRSLLKISNTVIAEAWKKNDLGTIKEVYYKSSINQFIIGAILFLGIIINLDNIFIMLTDKFSEGRSVIIFIGLAFLADMFSGASLQILNNSKYFKYGTYIMVFYALSIIVTNIIFIPKYGINGAAFATLISKMINNLLKILYVNKIFKLQPYNYKYLLILGITSGLYFLNITIPNFNNFIIDIIVRSSIISTLFALAIYFLKISDDINEYANLILNKLMHRFKAS